MYYSTYCCLFTADSVNSEFLLGCTEIFYLVSITLIVILSYFFLNTASCGLIINDS